MAQGSTSRYAHQRKTLYALSDHTFFPPIRHRLSYPRHAIASVTIALTKASTHLRSQLDVLRRAVRSRRGPASKPPPSVLARTGSPRCALWVGVSRTAGRSSACLKGMRPACTCPTSCIPPDTLLFLRFCLPFASLVWFLLLPFSPCVFRGVGNARSIRVGFLIPLPPPKQALQSN
jgi:hypothetical protein